MEDNEARVIDEAIKYIQLTQRVGMGNPLVGYPADLEDAVEDYLEANGESLETY